MGNTYADIKRMIATKNAGSKQKRQAGGPVLTPQEREIVIKPTDVIPQPSGHDILRDVIKRQRQGAQPRKSGGSVKRGRK